MMGEALHSGHRGRIHAAFRHAWPSAEPWPSTRRTWRRGSSSPGPRSPPGIRPAGSRPGGRCSRAGSDDPRRLMLDAEIAKVAGGPNAQAQAIAQGRAPEQAQFIRGMVAGLAARLQATPDDPGRLGPAGAAPMACSATRAASEQPPSTAPARGPGRPPGRSHQVEAEARTAPLTGQPS